MLTDKHKKRLKFWFIKIPIIVGLFCLFVIAALKLVERYPEPLKEGFEKYLSELTATDTTIGVLDKAAFYPHIDIRLRDMTMHRADNAAIIDIEAEKLNVSVPLSGIFVRRGKINLLDIVNFKAQENVLTPFAFHIEKAKIIDREGPDQYGSFIVADGLYAEKSFSFEAEIEKQDDFYIVPGSLSFSIILGEYELNTTTQQRDGNIILTNTTFQKGTQKSAATDYIFVEKSKYKTNNPLACLYQNAGNAIEQCDQYLE
jgi:hypothetical protein